MNITQKDFSAGWCPSDDPNGGRLNALLRMDNCWLDEQGILSLVPGTRKIGSEFPGLVHSIYSTTFQGAKERMLGLGTGDVLRLKGDVIVDTLLQAGHSEYAAFATAYGHIFCASGDKLRRYDGTNTYDVGLSQPGAPTVVEENGEYVEVLPGAAIASATVVTGTNGVALADSIQFNTTSTVGAVSATYSADAHTFFGGAVESENDRFTLAVRIGDSTKLKKMRVVFVLDNVSQPENYFAAELNNLVIPSPFNAGANVWSRVTCRRKDFERNGEDNSLTWANIVGARIEFEVTDVITVVVGLGVFFGSDAGQLDGSYEYVVVNVHANGHYNAKSAVGRISNKVRPYNGRTRVTIPAAAESHVNQYWLFRRSAEPQIDVTPPGTPQRLEKFYRVAILTASGDYIDEISDQDVLREAVSVDFRLASMLDVTDYIFGISDVLVDRILYLTAKGVIISDQENPDGYNPLHFIRFSQNAFEVPLFVVNVGPNEVVVATSLDLYRISGTFSELPDGTLDVIKTSLGVGFAPISRNFAVDGEALFYISSQGPTRYAGNTAQPILGEIKLLLENIERYEFPGIAIYPGGVASYPIAVHHGQYWFVMNMKNGDRIALIWDKAKQYWHARGNQAISIFSEEDGMLIAGFGGSAGNFLRELNVGTLLDEIDGHPVNLLTVNFDNNQPRNRKDIFTLKVIANTGNESAEIALSADDGPFVVVGNHSFNGMSERLFDLGEILTLTRYKRYALRLKGKFPKFELSQFTIEYEARPEQLTYLRILPTNLGTQSRKRFINYPIVVDTLGKNIELHPLVDNVTQELSVVNNADKLTHIHYFTQDTPGTDIGGILRSNADDPFEFYGLNLDEAISEKLPTPTKFLLMPQDDYGSPNRKRHSSYKFAINTRSGSVRFTPRLDGVDQFPLVFTTSEKRTVEYFFTADTISIDIGGKLESLSSLPFEFYGVIKPQDVETLPPRLKEFRIPENNYGIAAKKRIRTMPMIINTNNFPVSFIPIVDGVSQPSTNITTATKSTAFHYFNFDSFGVDYSADIVAEQPFEFYGLLKPEDVEILPVAKLFDQIGPFVVDRIGKLLAFRLRIIPFESILPYTVFSEDTEIYTGNLSVTPGAHQVVELMQIPKTVSGTVFRFTFGPTQLPFHRYDMQVKVAISGMTSDVPWLKSK